MQNPDWLCRRNRAAGRVQFRARIADFEVLVALRQHIEVKSVGRVGEKDLRSDFRVDGQRVNVGENDAENKRTQIIDVGDAAKIPEGTLGCKTRVLTALILAWIADPAIHHSLIVEEKIGAIARTGAEFSAFEPTAFRIIIGAHDGVHASIDRPIQGYADNISLDRRGAKSRNQEPALALSLNREAHKRKIEDGHAHQLEAAVVKLGGAVDINLDVPRLEQPLRTRQAAGGDRPLAHHIVVGPVFLDDFSREGKRIGRGHRVAGGTHAKTHRSNRAVEGSNLGADIVDAVTGLDVLVVWAAVQHHVAVFFAVSRVRVVGDLIRAQDVSAIVDFGLAAQVVNGTIFFLVDRPNRNRFFDSADRFRRKRRCRRVAFTIRYRSGGRGQRLAGYYRGCEKQMTDHSGRDKDSRAGGH